MWSSYSFWRGELVLDTIRAIFLRDALKLILSLTSLMFILLIVVMAIISLHWGVSLSFSFPAISAWITPIIWVIKPFICRLWVVLTRGWPIWQGCRIRLLSLQKAIFACVPIYAGRCCPSVTAKTGPWSALSLFWASSGAVFPCPPWTFSWVWAVMQSVCPIAWVPSC